MGVAPTKIKKVIGIAKAYATRVGSGPFPTELEDETGEKIREIGHEYGATTGRKRRCGWIDLPQLKYSIMINGVTDIALTKLDILNSFDEIEVCTAYEHNDGMITDQLPYDLVNIRVRPKFEKFKGWNSDISGIRKRTELPQNASDYVEMLERELKVPFKYISVGPERSSLMVD